LIAPPNNIQGIPTTSGPYSNFNVHIAGNEFEIFTPNFTSSSSEGALVSALTSISTKLDHLSLNVDASNCEVKHFHESVNKAIE